MVKIHSIIEALQADSRVSAYYYDRERDSVVQFTEDVADYETRTMIDDAEFDSSRYILLESDEYFEDTVMNEFIQTVSDPAKAGKLEVAANRFGASKHFRNAVVNACLEKEWSEFRGNRYKAEARHICEAYGIPLD